MVIYHPKIDFGVWIVDLALKNLENSEKYIFRTLQAIRVAWAQFGANLIKSSMMRMHEISSWPFLFTNNFIAFVNSPPWSK